MEIADSISVSQVCHWTLPWSKINLVYTCAASFSNIHFSILPSTRSFSKWFFFPSVFPVKFCLNFSALFHILYPPVRLLLSVTLIIFGENLKLWSSQFGIFLQRPIISSILVPNFHLSALLSKILNQCRPLSVAHKCRMIIKIAFH
jgi:hypothetical protein